MLELVKGKLQRLPDMVGLLQLLLLLLLFRAFVSELRKTNERAACPNRTKSTHILPVPSTAINTLLQCTYKEKNKFPMFDLPPV